MVLTTALAVDLTGSISIAGTSNEFWRKAIDPNAVRANAYCLLRIPDTAPLGLAHFNISALSYTHGTYNAAKSPTWQLDTVTVTPTPERSPARPRAATLVAHPAPTFIIALGWYSILAFSSMRGRTTPAPIRAKTLTQLTSELKVPEPQTNPFLNELKSAIQRSEFARAAYTAGDLPRLTSCIHSICPPLLSDHG